MVVAITLCFYNFACQIKTGFSNDDDEHASQIRDTYIGFMIAHEVLQKRKKGQVMRGEEKMEESRLA